jgi:hypothetical protein
LGVQYICSCVLSNNQFASNNYSNIDQNTPIILDKENIPPDAHGDHSHVGIAETTIRDSALSIVTGKDDPGILRAYCELVSCFYSTNKTFFIK